MAREPSLPELGTDLGWKSRAVCVDGPGARLAIGRHVEQGERVRFRVETETAIRMVVYESVGQHPSVPSADGVALAFVSFENEPCPGRDEKPCPRPPHRGGYCDRHQKETDGS